MFPARIPFRLWLVVLAVFFFLAGVVLRVSAASDFTFTSPSAGASIVGSTVTLKFSVPSYLKIVDYQTHPRATYGQGHIHLWIDQTPTPETAIHVTSDSYTLTHLKYGPHTVTAELVTNDHASLLPQTTTTLNFTTIPTTPWGESGEYTGSILMLSILAFIMIVFALYLVSFHNKQFAAKHSAPHSVKKSRTK